MKILKFGGTSVGSAQRIKGLLDIVNPTDRQIVVLSAVAGTTNALVEIGHAFLAGKTEEALDLIAQHKTKYEELIKELFATEQGLEKGKNLIDYHFNYIASLGNEMFTPIEEKSLWHRANCCPPPCSIFIWRKSASHRYCCRRWIL